MDMEESKGQTFSWHYAIVGVIIIFVVNVYLEGNIMFALGASTLPILVPLPLLLFIKDNRYLHYTVGMSILFFMALYGHFRLA